jgi:hypothetical protein
MPHDPAIMGELIPIIVIVGAFGLAIVKTIFGFLQSRSGQTKTVIVDNAGLNALREEVMKLRDTTTQYDMSVERALAEIRNRLDHVENRVGVYSAPSTASPDPQAYNPQTYSPVSSSTEPEQQITLGG